MKRISSSTPWEDSVGYSRAVVIGNLVEVSGTTATDSEGRVAARGDPYQQTRLAIENVLKALKEAGAGAEHVVRTRLYVTDIEMWEEYGRAHREFFGDARPASTMVQVSRLIHPDMLVEIEVTAILEP
ncbi:MAG: RidA family protein [Thermoplasmata archaeon]